MIFDQVRVVTPLDSATFVLNFIFPGFLDKIAYKLSNKISIDKMGQSKYHKIDSARGKRSNPHQQNLDSLLLNLIIVQKTHVG